MAKIVPMRNHIVFQFEDQMSRHMNAKQFETGTDWGFTFVKVDDSTGSGRWGVVCEVGPECDSEIKIGARIFVEPLMWTEGFQFKGNTYWRTDHNHVFAIDSSPITS